MTRANLVVARSCLPDVSKYLLGNLGFELQALDISPPLGRAIPQERHIIGMRPREYRFGASADVHGTFAFIGRSGLVSLELPQMFAQVANNSSMLDVYFSDIRARSLQTHVNFGDGVQISGRERKQVLVRANGIDLTRYVKCQDSYRNIMQYRLTSKELAIFGAQQPIVLPVSVGRKEFDAYNVFERLDLMKAIFDRI